MDFVIVRMFRKISTLLVKYWTCYFYFKKNVSWYQLVKHYLVTESQGTSLLDKALMSSEQVAPTSSFYAAQKMKFSIKDFFSKCDQIRIFHNGKLHFLCSVRKRIVICCYFVRRIFVNFLSKLDRIPT